METKRQITVEGRHKGIHGEIKMPGDKSISHRAVILGSIADGDSRVNGILRGEDVMRTIRAFQMMGIDISNYCEDGLKIKGRGLQGLREPDDMIDAGNSGTTIRLLAGLLSGQSFFSVLTGDSSLRRRPMKRVVEPLRSMGARIWGRQGGNKPPLAITGGNLKAVSYTMPVASAQVKSALLLAGLYAEGTTEITEHTMSRNHTELMLKGIGCNVRMEGNKVSVQGGKGFKGTDFIVPGDMSSAAFFIVAALLMPSSEIIIRDVGVNPTRTGIIDVLLRMGASIKIENVREWAGEPVGDICVMSSRLKGVYISGEDIPRTIDEFPILCVAASLAKGVTEISGASELRVKESDRIAVMAEELRKFSVRIEEREDGLLIEGGEELQGAECESHGDHRVAMALYVAGIAARGRTMVKNIECINTSFPNFFNLMNEVLC